MLQRAWQDNSLYAFAIALGVMLAVMLAVPVARFLVARLLTALARRTATPVGHSAARAVAGTSLWLLLPLALRAGAGMLDLAPRLVHAIGLAAIVGLALQAGLWASSLTRDWIERKALDRTAAEGDAVMALALLGFAARVVIWALVVLFALDQLGFNITALITGLGIGGIAVALAVQNILSDLFASLSIVLDKPFVVGDFIVVDNIRGTVESVGMKTTRLRSLDGEVVVFSNSDLLKSRIRNFRRLQERRIAVSIGIVYETPVEKVRGVAQNLREIIQAHPNARFDRAHFKEYGDSALVFEVVYYVLDANFNVYMDLQQAINLEIMDRFSKDGIAFAYPTRTIHLAASPTGNPAAA